jgi:hypothetical protein
MDRARKSGLWVDQGQQQSEDQDADEEDDEEDGAGGGGGGGGSAKTGSRDAYVVAPVPECVSVRVRAL